MDRECVGICWCCCCCCWCQYLFCIILFFSSIPRACICLHIEMPLELDVVHAKVWNKFLSWIFVLFIEQLWATLLWTTFFILMSICGNENVIVIQSRMICFVIVVRGGIFHSHWLFACRKTDCHLHTSAKLLYNRNSFFPLTVSALFAINLNRHFPIRFINCCSYYFYIPARQNVQLLKWQRERKKRVAHTIEYEEDVLIFHLWPKQLICLHSTCTKLLPWQFIEKLCCRKNSLFYSCSTLYCVSRMWS